MRAGDGGRGRAYPLWSVEQLVAEDPEVYFVTTEAAADPSDVAARPGYGQLAAVTGDRVYVIDSALITRRGRGWPTG